MKNKNVLKLNLFQINRNWRPGAIRFDVAEIIKKVRAGTIGPLPGRNWNKIK